MKKILFLHAGAELYGADRILINLVTGLDSNKYKPIVVLPSEGPLVKELRRQHVETHVIYYPILRRKYFNIQGIYSYSTSYQRSCRKIAALFKSEHISIIHVNTLAVLEGIYLKRLLHSKLIWHVHEIITNPRIVYKVTSFLAGHFANKIVAVSKQVKQHLVRSKFVQEEQVKIVYNGVDTKKFQPHAVVNKLKDEFYLDNKSIVVGMVGRLNSWKGQPALLRAMIPLLRAFPNLKLIFVGGVFKGEEHFKQELLGEIQSSGVAKQIVLKDFRSDMSDIYQLFDIFCLPSTNPDPLPTVVLEAMASGKPIVAFSHGGVTEMVQNNYNGILVPPVEVGKLSEAIQKLVSDPDLVKIMGERSRKRVIDNFSPEKFIEGFNQVYM